MGEGGKTVKASIVLWRGEERAGRGLTPPCAVQGTGARALHGVLVVR